MGQAASCRLEGGRGEALLEKEVMPGVARGRCQHPARAPGAPWHGAGSGEQVHELKTCWPYMSFVRHKEVGIKVHSLPHSFVLLLCTQCPLCNVRLGGW